MIRALGGAFVIAAVLASVLIGLIYFFPRQANKRAALPPEPPPAPALVRVLAGETAERAIILKDRYGDPHRAGFTDRSLAETLGMSQGTPHFVEVWVVNRGSADLASLGTPVTVTGPGGAPVTLASLRESVGPGSRSPRAEMLVSTLSPDPSVPLRKGGFRRTVYVMPASLDLRSVTSAEIDGVRLAARETTENALETFTERPRLDLLAALSRPEGSVPVRGDGANGALGPAETRGRPPTNEESR